MPKATLLALRVAPEPALTTTAKTVTSAKLDTLLTEYMIVTAKLDQLDQRKRFLQATLKDEWHKRHGAKIETEEYLSTEVPSHSSNISRELLLKAGVKVTVIAKATVQKAYTYVKVTRKQEVQSGD